MKKFTFKGVLDGFRSTVQPQTTRPEQEIQETLRPEHFQLRKVRFSQKIFAVLVPILINNFVFKNDKENITYFFSKYILLLHL